MNILKAIKNNIPNAITCMNLLSGSIACLFAMNSFKHVGMLLGYQWAFIFIGAAAVFDFCDGFAARLLHAGSAIGKELDSLSDSVSFGLAPAILVIALMQQGGAGWLSYSGLLIAVFGALRLARFNVDDSQATTFTGLPIPANAIFWIGYCSLNYSYALINYWVTFCFVLLLSYLMVCNNRMFSLKFHNLSFKDNYKRYLLIIAAILLLLTNGLAGLAWTIVFYVLVSLVLKDK